MEFSNPWFLLILSIILGFALLDFIVERLNLKSLTPSIPGAVRDFFDEASYAKSIAYERATVQYNQISSHFQLATFLIFWLLGGFPYTLDIARQYFPGHLPTALTFISLLYIGNFLLNFPFQWYETFHLEQKFGFNRTTPTTFITDRIKGILITALIGLPLLSAILWIFTSLPHAWLWAWGVMTAFSLLMLWLQPVVILPMFHKLTPLPDGPLRTAIFHMAQNCHFPVDNLFTVDGSRRSTKGNAFFTGFGSSKRIALYDTLIASLKTDEIVAVLAHEIGHQKRGHVPRILLLGIATIGLYLFLLNHFMNVPNLHAAFGIAPGAIIPATGLAFFSLLFEPLSRLTTILSSLLSRKHEFEADAYAAHATGTPQPLINALKRLSSQNFSHLTPHPLHVILSHSHPPLLQRVAALQQLTPQPP